MANSYRPLGPDYDWHNCALSVKQSAYRNGELVQYENNQNLSDSVRDVFSLLRHKDRTDDTAVIDLVICLDPLKNGCKSILRCKRNDNKDKSKISYPNASLRGHPCLKQIIEAKKKEAAAQKIADGEIPFDPKLIRQCKEIILNEGSIPCIVEDIRPYSFTEGDGMKKYAKSLIRVGTLLRAVPCDETINELLPFRKANTTGVKKRYYSNEQKLKKYYKKLNKEICPALHLSFDLWTDRGKKHHYIGIMAHEVNKEDKQMEVYCLEMIDWEDLNADDLKEVEGEAYDADEGSDVDEIDYSSVESGEEDTDIVYDEDSSSSDDDDADEHVDAVFVQDDALEFNDDAESDPDEKEKDCKISTKTSVTGDALQRNLRSALNKWCLPSIAGNKHVHVTGDRASNNVKAGKLMTNTFTSGVLHGLQTVVGGSLKRITKPYWRKPGQRAKKKNPYYRRKVARLFAESRQFARHVKGRGLNGNFNPTLKIVFDVRWNTYAVHLHGFCIKNNYRKVQPTVTHWIHKKKLTKKEKDHRYKTLLEEEQLLNEFATVLMNVKCSFGFLECEKTPTIHRVLYVIDLLLNGGRIKQGGEKVKLSSTFRACENNTGSLKLFKQLLYSNLDEKVLKHLLIEHWEAAILCPPLRRKAKTYLVKYKRGKNRYTEAVQELKDRVTDYKKKKDDRDSKNNENENKNKNNHNQNQPALKKRKLNSGAPCTSSFCWDSEDEDSPRRNHGKRHRDAAAEVNEYLVDEISHSVSGKAFGNPLEFWLNEDTIYKYPNLSVVALNILSIPAASAAVERLFSLAGLILSNRRLNTKTEHVGMICKLNRKKPSIK